MPKYRKGDTVVANTDRLEGHLFAQGHGHGPFRVIGVDRVPGKELKAVTLQGHGAATFCALLADPRSLQVEKKEKKEPMRRRKPSSR